VNWPKHFDGERFYNPGGQQVRGWRDVLRWKRTSRPEPSPEWVDDVPVSIPPGRIDGALRVTLVNHATVLLQQPGCNLLTDPIWSGRASPVSWAGPRRHRPPGVALESLPPIDVLLISHNHYDHLDRPTLARLASRGILSCVAPLGVGPTLRAQGIAAVHELDWGESVTLAGVTIHSVPAVHFSGRGLFDRNRTLWCGYVIESRQSLVYFAADTAFGSHFAAIRERFGAPRLALLPIGAYEPRWMMQAVHMNPEEAAQAHAILEAATSIAIHHGTFQLGDEAIDTPAKRLAALGLGRRFLILRNGQSADIP
jgi:L-ascorbate metabolism protein UlaG (beta-lactamase superfamily)